jgi:hypothetical protein
MLVLESKEPCDEERLTLGEYAWKTHHSRIDLSTSVNLGERAIHLETLSCGLN